MRLSLLCYLNNVQVRESDLIPLTFASHAYPAFHLLMPVYGKILVMMSPDLDGLMAAPLIVTVKLVLPTQCANAGRDKPAVLRGRHLLG